MNGVLVIDKPAGSDLARRGEPHPACVSPHAGRSSWHSRSDGDRRSSNLPGQGHPTGAVPAGVPEGIHRRIRLRRAPSTYDREGDDEHRERRMTEAASG